MSLGLALQDLFKSPGTGIAPGFPQGGLRDTSGDPGAPQPQAPSMQPQMSRGQLIAGILADALAGAAGRPAAFGQMLGQQREQQREEAQWSRRHQTELQDQMDLKRFEYANKPQEVAPALRDAQAWLSMTPDQQSAYRQLQAAKPQFIPDGLGGGQWAQPPAAGPKPGLTFIPLPANGGPTPPASGTFQ